MKITTLLLALGLCATAEAQTLPIKGTIVKPSDKHIQYVGRVNFDNPDRPKFNIIKDDSCSADGVFHGKN